MTSFLQCTAYLRKNASTSHHASIDFGRTNNFPLLRRKVVQIEEHGFYSLRLLACVLMLNIFHGCLKDFVLVIRHFEHGNLVKEYFAQFPGSSLQFWEKVAEAKFEKGGVEERS